MDSEKVYRIKSGRVDMIVNAMGHKDAWRKFFYNVIKKDLVKDIAILALMYDGEQVIAMRTVPALYIAGAIPLETAIKSLQHHFGLDAREAKELLDFCTVADRWAVDGLRDNDASFYTQF